MNKSIDFVIAQYGKKVGYISTNLAHTIYGYKEYGDIKGAILTLKELYPDHTYTFESIVPMGDNRARAFTDLDYIHKNKIITRLKETEKVKTITKGRER